MIEPLLNAMRLQAMQEGARRVTTRLAQVTSYDPSNYAAKVLVLPDGFESGWLPVSSPWVGNGWGMFCPPSPGDLVKITYQEDDIGAGIISLRLFTDSARPLNVPAGEFWLVHQSGSLLKFHNDGSVELTSAGTLIVKATSILLQNAGTLLKKLVNETFLALFDNHMHSNGNGGANTGVPTALSSASHKTSIVQAE